MSENSINATLSPLAQSIVELASMFAPQLQAFVEQNSGDTSGRRRMEIGSPVNRLWTSLDFTSRAAVARELAFLSQSDPQYQEQPNKITQIRIGFFQDFTVSGKPKAINFDRVRTLTVIVKMAENKTVSFMVGRYPSIL